MEGLIPFVYRAIVEYKNGNRLDHTSGLLTGCWLNDSPSAASYIRLPGDSGRFQAPDADADAAAFASADAFGFSDNSANRDRAAAAAILPSGVHSPVRRRSVAA